MRIKSVSFAVCALVAALLVACDGGREVEVVTPRTGTIRESFSEQARTRLANTYTITLPVDGRIGRINLHAGDPVAQGERLLEYDAVPLESAVEEARFAVAELEASIRVLDDNRLEDTALEETRAVVHATEEAVNAADKQVEAQQVLAEHTAQRLKEREEEYNHGAISKQVLDDARLSAETEMIELRKQEFDRASMLAMMVAVKTGPKFVLRWLEREQLQRGEKESALAAARARLALAEHRLSLADVRSPIDGVVLEKLEDGDRALSAGHPVLRLGNMEELEVVAEVLTQDAMRLSVGSEVELQPAARLDSFSGRVKKIEPQGFTKLSSLGVEQQRVNVIVSLDDALEGLGVGYRLEARFYTGGNENALIVPRFSVLQDTDGTYYVYRITGNTIEKVTVELGLRSDLELEIVNGLDATDRIVRTPDATMQDGDSVSVR